MFVGHTLAANEHVDTDFHLIFAVGFGSRPGVGQTQSGPLADWLAGGLSLA